MLPPRREISECVEQQRCSDSSKNQIRRTVYIYPYEGSHLATLCAALGLITLQNERMTELVFYGGVLPFYAAELGIGLRGDIF